MAAAQAPSPAERARTAFDKVDSAPIPTAQDCMECVQAHAALLPLARADQRYLVYYRRGYCALMSGAAGRVAADFQEAAGDLEHARESWPKGIPMSAGLLSLLGVARTGTAPLAPPDPLQLFTAAVQDRSCSATALMNQSFCSDLVEVARLWLAVTASRAAKSPDAFRLFDTVSPSAWKTWALGRQAFTERRWREAASLLRQAVAEWRKAESNSSPRTVDLLGPRPDPIEAAYDWALAEFRAGNYPGTVAAAQASIDAGSKNSYTWFVRARAEDLQGQAASAVENYATASRMATESHDTGWAVGQAQYYRGILLFRDGKYKDAAAAFAASSGAILGDVSRKDAAAWADLCALAAGDCSKAAQFEQTSAAQAASGFPVDQAQALWAGCRIQEAKTLAQLLDLERKAGRSLPAGRLKELKARIAEAYAAAGVAAEDRRDVVTAMTAYRNALDWNPSSTKARFNLGAIYLEQKNYAQAEAQYRALTEIDPADYEAQYWLAEAVLAQPRTAVRKQEACELLKRSLAIADPGKRAAFQKTLVSVKCQ